MKTFHEAFGNIRPSHVYRIAAGLFAAATIFTLGATGHDIIASVQEHKAASAVPFPHHKSDTIDGILAQNEAQNKISSLNIEGENNLSYAILFGFIALAGGTGSVVLYRVGNTRSGTERLIADAAASKSSEAAFPGGVNPAAIDTLLQSIEDAAAAYKKGQDPGVGAPRELPPGGY